MKTFHIPHRVYCFGVIIVNFSKTVIKLFSSFVNTCIIIIYVETGKWKMKRLFDKGKVLTYYIERSSESKNQSFC